MSTKPSSKGKRIAQRGDIEHASTGGAEAAILIADGPRVEDEDVVPCLGFVGACDLEADFG